MQELENMVTHLELVLTTANHDVYNQLDQHIKTMETQFQHAISTISETCQFYESQIKSYCTKEEEDLKDTIAKVLITLTQETIDDHISSRLDQQSRILMRLLLRL